MSSASPLRRTTLVPLLVLVGAGLVAALVLANRRQPERRQDPPSVPTVRTVRAELASIPVTISSHGEVRPAVETTLTAEVPGRIASVADALRPGGRFAAGEVLARIADDDFRLAVEQAEVGLSRARVQLELEQAEAEVARSEWRELGEGEPPPLAGREPQLARARAEVRAAEAAVEQARLDLARTVLRAPFAGSSRSLTADVGRYVARGTAVAEIFSTAGPEIVLPVGRADLAHLDLSTVERGDGPAITATAPLAGGLGRWTGRITRAAGALDETTRMLTLYGRLDGASASSAADAPPMGLFVDVEIAGTTIPDAFALPRAALRGDSRVWVVDGDDRLRFRTVEVARAEADRVIVLDGLTAGERVCVSPLDAAVDGMSVEPVDDPDGDGRSEESVP